MAKETELTGAKAELSSSAHNFPIVGIGASAGGLDAFKQLLAAIPVNSEMAYVVVQHLNPTHHSNLTEILSRVTKIPIEEITDEVRILPNHIYVMPSGKILTSVEGVLKLTPRENIKTNLVIDIFFSSLAVVWESMAVGVVLSGTGADGTAGLKMIKEYGGTTIVQDESAAYGDMPQSALDANVVDFVLPAGKIPAQLLKLNNDSAIIHTNEEEELLLQSDEAIFKQMLQLLLQRSGVDFTYYKQNTVRRRIGRRMAMHKRRNLADYLKYLRTDNDALDALFQDLLISVTSFFRDPNTFETLTEKVLPALFKSKPNGETVRFWIAGCATGEETYSIAICLHEYLTRCKEAEDFLHRPFGGRRAIQIFASDISEPAIKKARTGIYSNAALKTVSEERLSNYFTKTTGGYQVNKAVRDMCVFAGHNFLKDPPFAKIDLISCRNVLIYMELFLQKKALTTFHYALKENGTLLLGKSETAGAASELFTSFDKRHKIYSRKPGEGRFMQVATGRREETLTTQNTQAKKEVSQTDFRNNADAILLSRAPAAVVINEEMNIVHIHGDIEPFLKHSPGKPSLNLLKMAKEQLAIELRNAINKVKFSQSPVIKEQIPGPRPAKGELTAPAFLVTIEVIPLTDTTEPHYLIQFTKKDLTPNSFPFDRGGGTSKVKRAVSSSLETDSVRLLENELADTREDMRSIKEQMEAANEQLQTAYEELQSSNDELQSLNEELETSGEELQSINEELTSVNRELIDNQEYLTAARDYSEAIVTTVKQPLLVLDKNLRIKFANDSFYKKFNTIKTETEGKPLYEIQNNRWNHQELRKLLENILPQKSRMDDFEMILGERTMLLNAREIISEVKTAQLILLAVEDVTDTRLAKKLKASEARLAGERQVLYNSFMNAPGGIAIIKGDTHIYEFANDTYEKLVGKTIVIGKTVQEHFPEIEQQGFIQMLNTVFSTGKPFINNEIAIELNTQGNGIVKKLFINLVVQPLKDEKGNTERMMAHVLDVTEAVNARKLIEKSELFNRTILESSPDCLKVLDIEGRIQYMNFNGLCQMEIDDFSTVKNENWYTLWGSENESLVKESIDKALTGETARFTALCHTDKGTSKWWDVMVSPIGKPGETVQQIISVSRDVTEKKKSEEAIEKMAVHLKLATDSANVGTWLLDIETQKLEWSAVHIKLWGYDEHRTDLTYEDWHKLILPEDKEKIFEGIEDARINHSLYEVEYRINKAHDNVIRWMKSVGQYHYDDNGQAKTLTGISVDITQQKESELKLKASEEKYRGIFETMDQGFSIIEMIFDSDNKPVDCVYIETNPVFEKQTGLKNVTGKTARELIPNIEDRWFQIYGKVALTGKPNRFIEGSEALGRWFETYAFRLGDEGSNKVAVLFTDITERKQNEETLSYRKALLEAHNEANRDGLLLVDARGKIISYNQSFIDVWRMPKEIVDAKDDDLALAFAMKQLVNPQQFIDKVKWLYGHPSATSIDELEYLDGRIIERHGYSILGEDGTYYAWSWTFRDITEKKAAAAAIMESETRFRNMAEATEVLIGVADEKSNVTYFNKAWVDLTGRPMDDLLKLGWADLLHPEDKERIITIYLSAFAKQEGYTVEFRILDKNGKYRWLLAKVPARFHPDGSFAGYISASVDITDRKTAEERLSLERTVLYNSFMNAPAAIAIFKGITNIYEFANTEFEKLVGKKIILGKKLQEHSPELERQGYIQLVNNVFLTGEPFIGNEVPVERNKEGGGLKTLYINVIIQPIKDENGNWDSLLAHIIDVTQQVNARKIIAASEDHFRTFANSIQNLAWIANADGWTYWYNQRWYDYTGTTFEEMAGSGWQKVHHPNHFEKVREFEKEAWKKDAAFELTFPLRRYDGEYRWFLTRAYPVKDASGNIERWIGTNTDINEQKINEQQKDDFISIASHEMKTPLTTAKGYIDLLLLSLGEENQDALFATKANQAVERLHDLVTELLDASKIQNGQLNYNITKFDFNKMLDDTIQNFQLTTKNHILQKTGNCLQQITGDRGRLQQVLINLLSNAVKYSPKADKVLIKIEEQESNIQVSVQDFGVGMSRQHLDKIFERYYRVQEHAVHFQGLGIGLYISKNIIERHDGTMFAASEPEKGSTFYFTIPV